MAVNSAVVDERASYMADIAADALKPIVIEDRDSFDAALRAEPHGLVLVVAPWNYPYMTAINTVAPALIAGNAVILKHATQTLLVGERLVRRFHCSRCSGGRVPEHLSGSRNHIGPDCRQIVRFRKLHRIGRRRHAPWSARLRDLHGLGRNLAARTPAMCWKTPTWMRRWTR